MSNSAFSYLSLINFSHLYNWSVQYAQRKYTLNNDLYDLVPINEFLTRVKEPVTVEDNLNYKRVSIRLYNAGIGLRDIEKGINIGTKKQFRVHTGQFLLSKIDARNGAFGVVPEICDNAIITGNFWTFDVNYEKVNPYFLTLVMTSAFFIKLSEQCSNGTTNRHYLQENLFLDMKIPLPPLEKQKEIVDRYNEKIKLAEEQEKEAQNLEQEIDQYICETLGIKIQNQLEQNKISYLNFTSLKKLSRWDVYNNKNQVLSTKYNFGKLKDIIIGKPLYGAGEKGINRKTDVRYIRITDINEDGSLNNDVISAENVDEKYLLKENDFLIARSGNTVGKTFLYKENFGKCIYAGYLIKFTLNLQKIIPEYLLYYTKSTAYKAWINSNQRANAQPNINSNEYLNSPIIIPEIKIQQKLVDTISLKKEKIHNLKETSEQNRQLAQEEFEKELFE